MPILHKLFAIVVLIFTLSSAHALEKETYTQERFDALQAAGEVVLIDVYASWCSTCKKQQDALAAYRTANPDKKFTILEVDFDKNKDLVRQFRAPRQSTLLIYKGNNQFWYSVAESRLEVIAAELDKAINFKPKS
jgi:thioredoxin 1